jgi:hypothetical protein
LKFIDFFLNIDIIRKRVKMAMMMDSQQQDPLAAQLSSTYPSAPMEYVNMYTNENVKLGKAPAPPKIIKVILITSFYTAKRR